MPYRKIAIIAGEKSGDHHAAHLIRALKTQEPAWEIFGLGGTLMQQAGCRLLYDMTAISVIGFVEVLRHLALYRRIFYDTLETVLREKPDCLILLDYPGFNLRFAKALKKRKPDIKIIYYISPQLWAWHESRVSLIRHYIDKMIVIFPFEIAFYQKHRVSHVAFYGHPLLDNNTFSTPSTEPRISGHIGLFPGSRLSEIKKNLPAMLSIVQHLPTDHTFTIAAANSKCSTYIANLLQRMAMTIPLTEDAHHLMRTAHCAITASGTVTLELALLGTPMVIVYKISFFTWLLAKHLVKTPYIGMVNIIAEAEICPEFIQYDIQPTKIANYIRNLLTNPQKYNTIVEALYGVRQRLGKPGASQHIAYAMRKFLDQTKKDTAQ